MENKELLDSARYKDGVISRKNHQGTKNQAPVDQQLSVSIQLHNICIAEWTLGICFLEQFQWTVWDCGSYISC